MSDADSWVDAAIDEAIYKAERRQWLLDFYGTCDPTELRAIRDSKIVPFGFDPAKLTDEQRRRIDSLQDSARPKRRQRPAEPEAPAATGRKPAATTSATPGDKGRAKRSRNTERNAFIVEQRDAGCSWAEIQAAVKDRFGDVLSTDGVRKAYRRMSER